MSDKPSWMPHDEWGNLIANPAREAEKRRAEAALIRIAEHLDRQSGAANQETRNSQLANIRKAKERAVEEQDLVTAPMLRAIEENLMRGK